jgi:hypothetical protein
MAALWQGEQIDRASSTDWYFKYSEEAGYQVLEDIPPEKLRRLEQLREQLAADPRIEKIVPED